MKTLNCILWTAVASLSAHGQGTILFDTRVPGIIDARFYDTIYPMDDRWQPQLIAFTTDSVLPLFPKTAFDTSSEATLGYVIPVVVTVPGKLPGETVQIVMRAALKTDPTGLGTAANSLPIEVTLGGGALPPGYLIGLQSVTIIPEPSTKALVILSAIVLGISATFRRRGRPPHRGAALASRTQSHQVIDELAKCAFRVRRMKLSTTASGQYWNLSQGIFN